MGVWIETQMATGYDGAAASHPTWVCGLEPLKTVSSPKTYCHTLRGCVDGNTFSKCKWVKEKIVTPYVGVWIETL